MSGFTKYIFAIICVFALYPNADAQICENKGLESIYEKLPSSIKIDGEGEVEGFRVEVMRSPSGVITNLGIELPMLNGDSTLIALFVKRYFLDLLLAERALDIKNVLDRNKSKLFFNGAEYQKGPYWNLSDGLSLLKESVHLNINRDSLKYAIVWRDQKDNSLELDFPANVQIIIGKDKVELESEIESIFTRCSDLYATQEELTQADASFYTQMDNGVYAKIGDSFLLDSMSSTTYYTFHSDSIGYEPIYSPDMVAQTLINILLLRSDLWGETKIKVEHRMYGNQINVFEISTNTLRSFCEANGFDSYVGIEMVANEKIEATVLLHNTELNYLHMFHVMTDVDSLFGVTEKSMNARLFSYIPFDNIANLFEEYEN